jgi:hypothetical protein
MPATTRSALGGSALLAAALLAAPGHAQVVDADGLYQTLSLRGGFLPDPVVIMLDAGGELDASSVHANCRGWINPGMPDVALDLSAPTAPINIYAISDDDTTLVVRTPGGSWLCDDDTSGLNPLVRLGKPSPGRYAIWVGSYASNTYPATELRISEYDPDWPVLAWDDDDDWDDDGQGWDEDGLLGLPFDISGMTGQEIALELLQMAEPGMLAWRSVSPLGTTGFSIEGLRAFEFPNAAEPAVEIERLVVRSLDLDSLARDEPPLFADIRIEGLRADPEDFSEEDLIAYLDLEEFTLNLGLAYAIEPATGSLLVENLTIESPQLGSLQVSLGMSGLDLEELFGLTALDQALQSPLALNRLSLGYRDHGLMNAAMRLAADDAGQSPAAMMELLIGGMRAMAIEASGDPSPMLNATLQAAEGFMRDLLRAEGTGTLSIHVNPQRPIDAIGILGLVALPGQMVDILGLEVRYQR